MAKEQPSDPSNMRLRRAGAVRGILVKIAWSLGGIVVAALVAAALFISLINVDGVHRYLLNLAQTKATSMLRVPVRLANFSVDVPALRVDLYGLTIDGAAPHRTPPLLQVSHIAAGVRIVSIISREWYLSFVEVDSPVVWITRGSKGDSNLPVLPKGSGNSNIDLFSLGIRRVALKGGAIYFNDHLQDLSARLADLELSARYDSSARTYEGHLAYAQGQIEFGAIRPVAHTLDASFAYRPGTLVVKRATLTSGKSRVSLTGNVSHFSRPDIWAQYDATIDGEEMARILHQQWLPSGSVETKGTVTYIREPAKPLLATLTATGDASSRALRLPVRGHSISIRNMVASYSVAGGKAILRRFGANVLGGEVTVEGTETLLGDHQGGVANAKLHGISLRDAETFLQTGSPEPVALSGTLNGDAAARWGARFGNLQATVNAFTNGGEMIFQGQSGAEGLRAGGETANSTGIAESRLPLQAEVHAFYGMDSKQIRLRNTFFSTQGTQLNLNGTIGVASSLAVGFKSNELGALAALSSLFATQQQARRLRSLALTGEASFHGQIAGSIRAPTVSGYLEASNLGVNGSQWKSVHATLGVSSSLFSVERAYLAPASQGNIQVNARLNLSRWSLNSNDALNAAVTMTRIRVLDLARVSGHSIPADGTLNGNIHVQGSVASPSGTGRIQLTNATVYKQPVKSATLGFSASGGEVRGNSVVEIAGGAVTASATVRPRQRTYDATIRSNGIEIGRIHLPSLADAKATGVLRINASGQGSFDNPEVSGEIQVLNGSIEGHSLPGMSLQVSLDNRAVSASLSSALAQSPVEGHAHVSLTGDYPAELSIETGTFSLQPVLALYAPNIAEQMAGQTEIHLQLRGPVKNPRALVGEVTIPQLKLRYENTAAMEAAPIHIDYRDGVLHLNPTSIHGTDANLQLQGAVPIISKAPISLQIQGSVNLEIAQVLYPGLRAAGIARIDVRSGAGSPGGMSGQINIVNASVASTSFPMGLQNGNGVLSVNGDRIDIANFNGTIGGGPVTAHGGVSFKPRLAFDLGVTAANVRMLYPQGMREDLSASLRLTGSSERALLGGSVGISDVSFTPGFDLISMASQFSSGVSTPTEPGFSQNLTLDIAVQSTDTLNPANRTMAVSGTAALSVRGTAAHPALMGRVNLTGGSMIFHGDRFVLTSGTVQFVNPNQIRPILNLSLTTTIQQYDIDLRFTGPVDQMHSEYTSNPSLPRADIISLLAFGTTTEAQAKNATPANQMAESLIASQVSSQVTSRISKIAGISQLSISPVLTSGTAAGPPGAVITIRQQVTGNLFITFSTNVASAQDQTIQGQYKLSPRVSVSATRDPNGGFAVDVLTKKSW
jgi:translocation and assembly module TamB